MMETEAQREVKREQRRIERRAARIRNAHLRAARFTADTLLEDERAALRARDYTFHGVQTDEEGLAFIAFARDAHGHRLEAMDISPERAVAELARLARS